MMDFRFWDYSVEVYNSDETKSFNVPLAVLVFLMLVAVGIIALLTAALVVEPAEASLNDSTTTSTLEHNDQGEDGDVRVSASCCLYPSTTLPDLTEALPDSPVPVPVVDVPAFTG